jgi:hypothetical protein
MVIRTPFGVTAPAGFALFRATFILPERAFVTEPIQAPTAEQSKDEVRDLATALAVPSGPTVSVTKGVVTAFNLASSPPALSLQLNGDTSTTIANVRFIDSYSPTVSDTVLVLKQGSDIFALGQINDANEGNSANGWVTPTLGSSFSHDAAFMGNLQYRVVVDNGDRKLQFKGSVNVLNSSSGTLFTLPFGLGVNRNVPIVRDGVGSNIVVLQVNASGAVSFNGGTTAPASTSTPTGTDTAPSHNHTIPLGGVTGNGGSHFHNVNSHSHTNVVAYPTWLSLNGVEVFL